jgi:hypothetical protein
MQISRCLLLACVATICFSPLFLIAEDSPAQIKARQALEQQLNGTPGTPPPAPAVPPAKPAAPAPTVKSGQAVTPAPVVKPAPTVAPAPIVVPPPVVKPAVQPVPANTFSAMPEYAAPPTNTAASPEAIEKARAALRQTMSQSETPSHTMPMAATPAPAVAPAAAGTSEPVFLPLPGTQATANQPVTAQTWITKPAHKQSAGKPSPAVFQPLTEPATGLAASKEERLLELLQRYKADAITPEQYHAERAKILAEP